MTENTAETEPKKWTPEGDPHGVTFADIIEKDWVLGTLIDMLVGPDDSHRGSLSLTIQSNGATVTGMLISGEEYFESMKDILSSSGNSEWADATGKVWERLREDGREWTRKREEANLPQQARRFIHMRDVRILSGSMYLDTSLWRGTLADVTGWSLGSHNAPIEE